MSHVALLSMSGTRVRDVEMARLGMSLPGLRGRVNAISALPPLGLLTLAGMTPDEWSVSLHEVSRPDDSVVQRVVSEAPALVAISALTASVDDAYAVAAALRREGVRTALGGLHATTCPDEAEAFVDAVVVGDGEPVWHELLRDAERRQLRPRYQSRQPFDLSNAPMPDYGLLGTTRRPRYTLQTERGCPFACDFCGASRLLGPFREKPVALIRRELEAIANRERNPAIELADDNTFARRRDAPELLAALASSGASWFTEVDWRLGERPEIIRSLARSGCVQVLIGLESLVHRHGGMGLKQSDMSRMLASIDRIQNAGVVVIGCFIVGSDGETESSIDALGDLLERLDIGDVQLTVPTPFPGTALRQRLEREGRLLPDRGWSACTLFDVAYQPDRMSAEMLESRFRAIVARTFRTDEARRRARLRRQIWRRSSSPLDGDDLC